MTSAFRSQATAAMAQLVAVREDLMVDECTVTRPAPLEQTPELDPETGQPITAPGTPVYQGRCTIADPSSALVAHRTVTDDAGVPNKRILRVPHDANLLPGDLLEVTSASISPSLVGDVFTVVGEEERTFATFRKYVLRGSSWLAS